MPYTTLPPKLPVWAQWAVVAICLALSAVYLAVPHGAPGAMLTALSEWAHIAFGRTGAVGPVLLPASSGVAQDAKPLARFGEAVFVGCDLSLKDGVPNLVTNWQTTPSKSGLDLTVRLQMPTNPETVELEMPLNGTQIETALPPVFFSSSARGQVWIKVTERDTGLSLTATESLGLASSGGWTRICR